MNGLIGTSQSSPMAQRDFDRISRGIVRFDVNTFQDTLARENRALDFGPKMDETQGLGFGPSFERQLEMGPRNNREQFMLDQLRANSEGLKLDEKTEKELKDKVAEFVAIAFLNPLMKMARESRGESKYFSGGQGEKVFGAQMDQEIAMQTAKNGGLGLVDVIYKQLTGNLTGEGVDHRA